MSARELSDGIGVPEGDPVAALPEGAVVQRVVAVRERQEIAGDQADHADEEDDRAEHRSASLHRRGLGCRLAGDRGRDVARCRAAQVGATVLAEGDAGAVVRPAARAGHAALRGARTLDRRRDARGDEPLAAVAAEGEAGWVLRPAPRALRALPDGRFRIRDAMRGRARCGDCRDVGGRVGLGLFRRRPDVRGCCSSRRRPRRRRRRPRAMPNRRSASPPRPRRGLLPRHRRPRLPRSPPAATRVRGSRPRPRRPAPARSSARFPPRLRRLPAPPSARRVTLPPRVDRLVGRRRVLARPALDLGGGGLVDGGLRGGDHIGLGRRGLVWSPAGACASGSPAGSSAGG